MLFSRNQCLTRQTMLPLQQQHIDKATTATTMTRSVKYLLRRSNEISSVKPQPITTGV